MNPRTETMRIDNTQVNVRYAVNFLSCGLALFPSLFYDLGSTLNNYQVLFIYLISLFLAVYSVSQGRSFTISISQIGPFLLWIIVFLICIFNRNGDISHSNYRPILHLLFIILYSTVFVAQNKIFIKNILRVLTLYLLIHLILGFYFWLNPNILVYLGTNFFNLEGVIFQKFLSQINNGAFMSFTSHYSTSGMYMSLAVILFVAFIYAYRNYYLKWNTWYVVIFGVSFVALGLTQKRAHLLFAVFAIVVMYLVGYVKGNLNRKMTQVLFLLILAGFAIFLFFQIPAFQSVISRFAVADSLDEVSSGRISNLWAPAWKELKNNPVLGIGWHQFKYLHPMSNGIRNDVHNIYIQFVAENGFIVAIYIIALMAYTYISTWKLVLKSKYRGIFDEYLYLMFSLGYQTFFILYGMTGNPFYDIQCFFPYMICCSITYLYQNKYKKAVSENDSLQNVSFEMR